MTENLSKEKNRLEELQEIIANAPTSIEEEFTRTENSWLACFAGSVDVIDTYLESPQIEGTLSEQQLKETKEKVEMLKEELKKLEEKYPDKENVPPPETKAELLGKLATFF